MNSLETPLLGLLPLLSLSLLVGSGPGVAHEVRFAPAAGTTLTKTFTSTTTLESEALVFAIDGDENAYPPMGTSATINQVVTVTDVYDETRDGSPTTLVRTFGDLSREFTMQVEVGSDTAEPKGKGVSPLSQASVTFTQQPDSDSYGAEFTGDEQRDASLLAGLEEDMDLRVLLPGSPLEVDQTYEIPATAFADLLHAGGDLSFAMEIEGYPGAGGLEPSMMTDYRSFFEDIRESKGSGKLLEVANVDGKKVARIELSLQFVGVADIAEAYSAKINAGRPEGAKRNINQFEIELICDGTGELLWNLDTGVMSSVDFQGKLDMGMALEAVSMQMEQEMVINMTSSHSGGVTISVRAE